MKNLKQTLTTKILNVMNDVHNGNGLTFHAICRNNKLPISYITKLKWALLQRGVCFQEAKLLVWNPNKTVPNESLALSIHSMLGKYQPSSSNVQDLTDKELVEELRRRGYTVSCTKQIIQEIAL